MVYGAVAMQKACQKHGVKPIFGCEISVVHDRERRPCHLVLLATDRASYGRLCRLITKGRRAAAKGGYRLERADLEEGVAGCLALLLPSAPFSADPFSAFGDSSPPWSDRSALGERRFHQHATE